MWPFNKKENLLSKARKLTKEGKEKTIKETVNELKKAIMLKAKEGKTSITEHVDEDIRDEVLKLIQKEGFEVKAEDWYAIISW